MRATLALILWLVMSAVAYAQPLQQAGTLTPGHALRVVTDGVVADAGSAAGASTYNGGYLTSLGITATGLPFCINDALTSAVGGYHQLCLGASSLGGGLISFNAEGGASQTPFSFNVNGTTYAFPFVIGGIVGPTVSVINDLACWNNLTGTLLLDCPSTSLTAIGTITTGTWNATPIANAFLANSTISGVSLGGTLNSLTFGTHLTAGGSSYNGSSGITISTDATNADTVSTIVARDSSGNFSAGTITASLIGGASLDLPLSGGTLSGALHLGSNTVDGSAIAFTGGTLSGISVSSGTWSGGTLAGSIAGTPIFTAAPTFAGNLTIGSGTGGTSALFQGNSGASGAAIFEIKLSGLNSVLNVLSGNTGSPNVLSVNSATNTVSSNYALELFSQGTASPTWSGNTLCGQVPVCSTLTWTGTSTVSSGPTPIFEFVSGSYGISGSSGGALVRDSVTVTSTEKGDFHLYQLSVEDNATTANTGASTFDILNFGVIGNFRQGGTGLTSTTALGSWQASNPQATLGPHATYIDSVSSSEDDIDSQGEIVTGSISGTTLSITAGCSATIMANDTIQSFAAWTLSSNVVTPGTEIVSGSCSGSTGTFTVSASQTITSEQMAIGSSMYAKFDHYYTLSQGDATAGTVINAAILFGAFNLPAVNQGWTYLEQVGAPDANNPNPNGWFLGYSATTPAGGGGITNAGVFDFTNLTVTTAYMRSDATNSKFVVDPSGNAAFNSLTSGSGGAQVIAAGAIGLTKLAGAPGTAPGAGFVELFAVAGTNSGSCKIEALAGTSTTPVLIIDNVGVGC